MAGGTRADNIRYSAAVGRRLSADFEFMAGNVGDYARQWLKCLARTLPWIFVGIAPLLMYHRVYIESGKNIAHFWGDTTNAYWPDLVFFTRSIAQGEFPLWDPNDRGGFPFAFDPQPGVLYPINWLFVSVGLLLGRMSFTLFQFKILVHLSITSIGWYAWLNKRVTPAAAAVGAIGATFGCFTLQHVHYGLIWPIAFVPWFLAALDRWLASRSVSAALCMGASVGAIVAAGSPPAALYGLMICASFGIPQLVGALSRATGSERRKLLVTGALSTTLAAALSAPAIIGTAHLTAASVLEKRDFSYISSGSLVPADLLACLFPSTSGALVYVGTSLVGLAVVGVVCRGWQRQAIIALVVGVCGTLLALGSNTPMLKWAIAVFPPVRFFRLPFRYLYLTQIALGVLAALGTDTLLRSRRSATVARIVLFGVLVLGVWAWLNHRGEGRSAPSALTKDMFAAVQWSGLIFVACLLCWDRSFKKWASFSIAFFVLADFEAFVPRSNVLRNGAFELPRNISNSALKLIERQSAQYRVWDEFGIGFRAGSRLGIRDLRGYMDPLRLANYEKMVSQLMAAPDLLNRWGVRWALPADHPYVGAGHKHANVARLKSVHVLERHVLELPNPRAPGFFTDKVESRSTESGLWLALERDPLGARVQLPPLFGLNRMSANDANQPLALSIAQQPATLIERRNNSLAFQIDAPTSGWFVVNEAYFPGWSAWVDGNVTPIYRVDGWIRGLQVSKGVHRIELKFRPTDWIVTASIASILWLVLAVLAVSAIVARIRVYAKQGSGPIPQKC